MLGATGMAGLAAVAGMAPLAGSAAGAVPQRMQAQQRIACMRLPTVEVAEIKP